MKYAELTIKTLYGRSYNECNHPDCTQMIIELDPNTGKTINHGKIAHIRARKTGGERWDKDYPPSKLHSIENLILLCAKHHDIIDQPNAAKHYTVEHVESWKVTHYQIKEMTADREWVYGGSSLQFSLEQTQYVLNYWRDKQGNVRFFTPHQWQQAQAAMDLAMLLSEVSSLISYIESAEATPADLSHVTMNDAYLKAFKEKVEWLKRGGFETGVHRLYSNLSACPDITLSELALVGTDEKMRKMTIIVGDATMERVADSLKNATK